MSPEMPVSVFNLLSEIRVHSSDEQITALLALPGVRIERIVSWGHATPDDAPYDQSGDEWVMLVAGAARLWIEGQGEIALGPGDYLLIPAHRRHRVTWTSREGPTVWLAVHVDSTDER